MSENKIVEDKIIVRTDGIKFIWGIVLRFFLGLYAVWNVSVHGKPFRKNNMRDSCCVDDSISIYYSTSS